MWFALNIETSQFNLESRPKLNGRGRPSIEIITHHTMYVAHFCRQSHVCSEFKLRISSWIVITKLQVPIAANGDHVFTPR